MIEKIREALDAMFDPDQPVELRALGVTMPETLSFSVQSWPEDNDVPVITSHGGLHVLWVLLMKPGRHKHLILISPSSGSTRTCRQDPTDQGRAWALCRQTFACSTHDS